MVRPVTKTRVYIACWFLFISHQLLQKGMGIHIPLVHSYLDDLLLFPIVMPFLQRVHWWFTDKPNIPIWFSLSIFVFMTGIVEFIYPRISDSFTTDYWDFVAYFAGMIVYWVVFENRFSKIKSSRP